MKIKNKIAIGCFMQWYEIEIIEEYLESLKLALDEIENPENVKVNICFNLNQGLEKIDSKQKTLQEIKQKFIDMIENGIFSNYWTKTLSYFHNDIDGIYTIADYRREFNDRYCEKVDILMWGETDALIPHNTFEILDNLHLQSIAQNIPKYVATFGICKMWDNSWKSIEHIEFTDKPFIVNDYDKWWSLKYTMSIKEMNKFNYNIEELDVRMTTDLKFNGCGLVISSDVIKSGVNIPKSVFFIHEDTAFQEMLKRILPGVPQYIIKNILIVHNRNHPKKRSYVKEGKGKTLNMIRRTNPWYVHANKMSEHNTYNLFNQSKVYTWDDVWKAIKNGIVKKNVLFWVGVRSTSPLLQEKHGNFEYLDISKKCWEWWCKKNDVIFFEYNTPSEQDTNAHRATWTRWFDVFDQIENANINYNKIAIIDGSTLCKWNTPNFFDLVDDRLVAFRSLENVKWIHQGITGYQKLFPNVKFNLAKYVNCGFQIFNKNHKPFLKKLKKFYYDNYNVIINLQRNTVKKGTDQPIYNYLLQQEKIDVNMDLNPSFMLTHLHRFNWVDYNWQLNEDTTPFYIKYGYIWFYSGFTKKGDRKILMQQTWNLIKKHYD